MIICGHILLWLNIIIIVLKDFLVYFVSEGSFVYLMYFLQGYLTFCSLPFLIGCGLYILINLFFFFWNRKKINPSKRIQLVLCIGTGSQWRWQKHGIVTQLDSGYMYSGPLSRCLSVDSFPPPLSFMNNLNSALTHLYVLGEAHRGERVSFWPGLTSLPGMLSAQRRPSVWKGYEGGVYFLTSLFFFPLFKESSHPLTKHLK